MKKKWWIPIATFFSAIAALGIFFTNIIMFMKKKDEAVIRDRETKAKRWVPKDFDSLLKTQVMVESPFGYKLDCLFVKPYPTNKWMIFCHGITENKFNSIKYMNIFLKKGYNAIIYDHRRHGDSGGKTSSYGYYEKWDLEAVVKELKNREGDDVYFGIHGESMGAATCLLYAGTISDDAAFYVADCPFSSFQEQVKYRIKESTPLPNWLVLPIGNSFLKMRDGYRLQDVSPIEVIQNIKKPVLFIHSELDTYIPVSMTKQLFEKKPGKKQLFIAPNGAHAQSLNENPEEYEKAVDQFLKSFTSDLSRSN